MYDCNICIDDCGSDCLCHIPEYTSFFTIMLVLGSYLVCDIAKHNSVHVHVTPSHESRGARQVHSNTNQDNTFFQRKKMLPWVGLEPTTLCFLDRVLFLLSYQGSSAGRALSLQYNTTQGKVKPVLWHRKPSLNM